jgi:hypothetical protein
VAVLVLCPGTVRANVGPPYAAGQTAAELVGIEDVAITRERLDIDLRPLAANGRVRVEAVYYLHNHGAEKKLDLLFASGADHVSDFRVSLDEQPAASAPATGVSVPGSWHAPAYTPGLNGGPGVPYHGRMAPIAFAVIVPPGPHTLKVRYAAVAGIHYEGQPTVYRQFAYVLAPARSWAGFGGLDLTVRLPEGWHAASTPGFRREGDTLEGSFGDIPADALALTVQAPPTWAYRTLANGSLGLLGLAGLGGAWLCWWGGRAKGRVLARPTAGRSSWLRRHAWPRSIGLGLVWAGLVLVTGLFAIFGPDWVVPDGQVNHYGYGQAFALIGVVFLTVLAVPIGFAITLVTAASTRYLAASSSPTLVGPYLGPATDSK